MKAYTAVQKLLYLYISFGKKDEAFDPNYQDKESGDEWVGALRSGSAGTANSMW